MTWALKSKGRADVRSSYCFSTEVELRGGDPSTAGILGMTVAQWVTHRSLWGHTDNSMEETCPLGWLGKLFLKGVLLEVLLRPPLSGCWASCSLLATTHQSGGALGRPVRCEPCAGEASSAEETSGEAWQPTPPPCSASPELSPVKV